MDFGNEEKRDMLMIFNSILKGDRYKEMLLFTVPSINKQKK